MIVIASDLALCLFCYKASVAGFVWPLLLHQTLWKVLRHWLFTCVCRGLCVELWPLIANTMRSLGYSKRRLLRVTRLETRFFHRGLISWLLSEHQILLRVYWVGETVWSNIGIWDTLQVTRVSRLNLTWWLCRATLWVTTAPTQWVFSINRLFSIFKIVLRVLRSLLRVRYSSWDIPSSILGLLLEFSSVGARTLLWTIRLIRVLVNCD